MFFQQLLQLASFWSIFLTGSPGVEVQHDLVYKQTTTQSLILDLYRPTAREDPVPVVVIVHGGLWVWGHNRDYRDICLHLARQGIACAPINFRSLPRGGYLDQVDDVKDAIRWVRKNADALGLDPERIGLFGSSSGGHLAGLAGFAGNGEGFSDDPPGASSAVRALFLLYGAYDLEPFSDRFIVRVFAGDFPSGTDAERFAFYSHINHIDGTEPITCILHGTEDRLVPYAQAAALLDALRAKSVGAELHPFANGAHGFAKVKPWTRPLVFQAMLRFFSENL